MKITYTNKKTILAILLSAVIAFVFCGCSSNDFADTYWRNDKTGDWLIGLTED